MSEEKTFNTDNDGEVGIRLDGLDDNGLVVVMRTYDNDSGETTEALLCAATARKVAAALIAAASKAEDAEKGAAT